MLASRIAAESESSQSKHVPEHVHEGGIINGQGTDGGRQKKGSKKVLDSARRSLSRQKHAFDGRGHHGRVALLESHSVTEHIARTVVKAGRGLPKDELAERISLRQPQRADGVRVSLTAHSLL